MLHRCCNLDILASFEKYRREGEEILIFFKCGEGQKEVGRNTDKVNSQSKALKWEFV